MEFLYATDGSESARAAGQFLAALPLTEADVVTLLTVIQQEENRGDARPALDAAAASLGPASAAHVRRAIRRGNAAVEILDAIVSAAEEAPTNLIVLGTRGLSGLARFLVGSTAERVARFAPCSVLLARPLRAGLKRVVFGFDGSLSARRAAAFLTRLPLPEGCVVEVNAVVPPAGTLFDNPFLPGPLLQRAYEAGGLPEAARAEAERHVGEAARLLSDAGRSAKATVREGRDPAAVLLAAADEDGADLIVVGAQGASAFDRYTLGGVAERVIRHAAGSVLVVRAQQTTLL